MDKMNYKENLIGDMDRLILSIRFSPEKSKKYNGWKQQIISDTITDINLAIYLNNHYNYCNEKDREQGRFLRELLEKNGLFA
jgi:hypothetical protein